MGIRQRLNSACALVLLLALQLLFNRFAHADAPITLAAYRSLVNDSLSLVDQAIAQKNFDARVPLLKRAADLLDSARTVQLDTSEPVTIHNEPLVAQIRAQGVAGTASAEKLLALRQRLQALVAALATSPQAPSADDDAKLRDLLSKPPFKQAEQAPNEWQRLLDELLSRLFGATAQGIFSARDFIVVLGLLLVAVVLAFFAYSLRRNAVREVSLSGAGAPEQALTSAAALDSAQQLAGTGDYRSAMRQLYLSTLLWLDEHAYLRYDRSLTNREYLRTLTIAPALRDALQPVVEAFDHVWYGFAPISAPEFERYRNQVEAIRNLSHV